MSDLVISNLCKTYPGGTEVLRNLNLTVPSGHMFFLLGPSGCGKSTLLRIIAGLIPPTSGAILRNGTDLLALPPEKRNTPMVFQNYALWPHLDVFENIAFPLRIRRLASAEIHGRVEKILETVRMSDCAHRMISSLSGGQQQRVALARALVTDPEVLLLDEPLSNLDAKLRDFMRVEIRRICRERHLTALYVTHDRREALSMADSIAVMNNGKLEQIGTPREIYERPATRFTASFLGDVNYMEAVCRGREGAFFRFESSAGSFLATASGAGGEPCENEKRTLMFRPEAVRFDGGAVNRIHGVLREQFYLGEITQMTFESGDLTFMVNEQAAPERASGSEWDVRIPPEHLICPAKES